MGSKQIRSNFMLLLTAFIWGVAFVAQSEGMKYIGPFTFNGVRLIIGGIVLIPCVWFFNRPKKGVESKPKPDKKTTILGGIICGVILFGASSMQQIGLIYTTAGKAGFITTLYIIIVPFFGLFLHKKMPRLIWISVAIATIGMYLLCIKEGFRVELGDFCVMICALIFTAHILAIDYFSSKVDGILLSCIQFFVSGILSVICMLLWEHPEISSILQAWLPILYAGVLSAGVGYTLQILGQRDTNPAVASLLMSTESVFAVLSGWLLLGERLSWKEMIGCALLFIAVLLVQLPERQRKKQTL